MLPLGDKSVKVGGLDISSNFTHNSFPAYTQLFVYVEWLVELLNEPGTVNVPSNVVSVAAASDVATVCDASTPLAGDCTVTVVLPCRLRARSLFFAATVVTIWSPGRTIKSFPFCKVSFLSCCISMARKPIW